MAEARGDIRQRLLAIFRVEAEEQLQAIGAHLLALDRGLPSAQASEAVEATFRGVHTLKGAARSVSLLDVEAICQAMETVLSRLRRGEVPVTPPVIDLLQRAVDSVARLLAGGEGPGAARDLIARLERAAAGLHAGPEPAGAAPAAAETGPPPTPAVPRADVIRVMAGRLDALLLQGEDLLALKLAGAERAREARALLDVVTRLRAEAGSRRGPAGHAAGPAAGGRRPDGAGRRGELAGALREVERQARTLAGHLAADERAIGRAVDDLQQELRRLRLTPAAAILDVCPRMVRDLARDRAKAVEWEAEGADLEVDRRVLEAVKDPLIHLVRNAVDHGIETPEVRAAAGKPAAGRVAVRVRALEGNRIEMRVEDDGCGIDLAQVRAAAVRARLLTAGEAEGLADGAALDLVFRAGLSTKPMITELSGHGLGLAIVKERVDQLGGQVRVETRPGGGTAVRLILPATVATFRGLLVRAAARPFLLPTEAVARAIRVAPGAVERVEGRDAIRWNGHAVSLARLGDVLGLPADFRLQASSQPSRSGSAIADPKSKMGASAGEPCVVVRWAEDLAAFVVEDIVGEREVLVKALGPPLVRVRNVAAAGLLGTGEVVLILRPADLLRALREAPAPPAPAAPAGGPGRRPRVLVVDDSITTRAMERNLLEAAGYEVRVAADGIEAWTALKTEPFDLVVSDVDMPRLDGFGLTARLRADRELADLPVVLVTALESREDKERGIEVGANAYVVKSTFDQSNLLEIMRRLL